MNTAWQRAWCEVDDPGILTEVGKIAAGRGASRSIGRRLRPLTHSSHSPGAMNLNPEEVPSQSPGLIAAVNPGYAE